MSRLRKQLLVAGIVLLLVFGALLGYASYEESTVRNRPNATSEMDYGVIPFDLLQGRTRYTSVEGGTVRSLDTGPMGETRVTIARTAFGVGALAAMLLIARVFVKDKT